MGGDESAESDVEGREKMRAFDETSAQAGDLCYCSSFFSRPWLILVVPAESIESIE